MLGYFFIQQKAFDIIQIMYYNYTTIWRYIMAMQSVLQVRMDTELKEAAEKLYEELGTSFAEAVRIFAKKSVDEQAIPFSVNKIKKHKAFGALKKYADPSKIGRERELLGEAIAKEYVENNRH